MMGVNVRQERAQFFDRNGNPLSNGTVNFYSAGTLDAKEVFHDSAKTVSAGSSISLDISGFVGNSDLSGGDGGLWYGVGTYKIEILDENGELQWKMDNISGDGTSVTGILSPVFVTTVDNIRDLDASVYSIAYAKGYYDSEDNGGGWFYYNPNSEQTENQGTVIVPTGGGAIGRWIRIINDDHIRPEMFGAVPNDNSLNLATRFELMIEWCKANNHYKKIHINPGIYYTSGPITFDGDITVEIDEGAGFRNNGTGETLITISCNDAIIHCFETPLVTSYAGPGGVVTDLSFNPLNKDREAYVEWWSVSTDSLFQLLDAVSGCPNRKLVFSSGSTYSADGSVDFSGTIPVFRNGSKLELTNGTQTFNNFLIEQKSPAFGGDMLNLVFPEYSNEFEINWFDIYSSGTTVSSSKYENLIVSLTSSGSRYITLYWKHGKYEFIAISVNDVAAEKINQHITGAEIFLGDTFKFGRIVECSGGIDPTALHYPIVNNDLIDCRWFGAVGENTSDTQKAINSAAVSYAIQTQLSSLGDDCKRSPKVTSGDAGSIYILDAIDISNPQNKPINFYSLNISTSGTFNPVQKESSFYMIALRASTLNMDKCCIECETLIDVLYILGSCDLKNSDLISTSSDTYVMYQSGSSGVVSINQCSLSADRGFTVKGDILNIKDSDIKTFVQPIIAEDLQRFNIADNQFLVDDTNGSLSIVRLECSIQGVFTGNKMYFNGLQFDSGTKNVLVEGNVFRGEKLVIEDPNTIKVQDNQFIGTSTRASYIELATDIADQTAIQLIIEDNQFSTSGSAQDIIQFSGSGSIATTGHTARIRNNAINGMNLKATEYDFQYTLDALALYGSQTGDAWLIGAIDIPVPDLILGTDEIKIVSFSAEQPKVLGVDMATSEFSGIVEIYDRTQATTGSAYLQFKWYGKSVVGGDTVTQDYSLKLRSSEVQ